MKALLAVLLFSVALALSHALGWAFGWKARDLQGRIDDIPRASAAVPDHPSLYHYQLENIRVIDGDTIEADVDLGFGVWQREQHLRLLGIDAPEMTGEERPEGEESKAWLQERIYGQQVIASTYKEDREDSFGRWLAVLWVVEGAQEVNVCEEMVAEGVAQVYTP